ncbi:protein of unknown function [Taphrina deformans PYCC 5710]|uniref:Adhesin domain-containing protein n=1 Tax=Taphrina deformans (strain PYCC 5710 / ATCC 11124 / CBS 356.35 / IMI 108563 / JCM 9778 / NBRC 8474) TaxID=1097556 RepID=R4X8Z4_TAPDE|nr:protein of unknown function [Taphrina deformans PYCC 5710]|eukprot:CCG82139.1 protein of unknown function [Taphrina deformans PYCC 5710]
MSSTTSYPQEKVELPAPVTAPARREGPGFLVTLLRCSVIFFGTLFLLDLFAEEPASHRAVKGCMGAMERHGRDHHHGQHPFPPVHKWKPFQGISHFELEPEIATGLTIKGAKTFGKIVFETSKLSDKVVIDLDVKTSKTDKNSEVTVVNDNGYITVNAPDTGRLKTFASAKIQIPSNLFGTYGLPKFEVDVPQHLVDLSGLPESLEIGELIVRVAKGFVKAGPVHTNTTQLTVVKGGLRGALTSARESTNIDVANGNVTVDITKISSGSEGSSTIHLGDGDLKGTFSVYNSTTIDVAKGSIYVTVDFADAETRAELSTKIASGDARVFVNSIAAERTFDAYHTSISGSQLITYPENFQGTVTSRNLVGNIKLAGKDLAVEKTLAGRVGKKGDSERNSVSVKAAKGDLDILIGDEVEDDE